MNTARPVLAFAAAVAALAGCAAPGPGGAGPDPVPPLPFTATGNEPGWRVDLGESRLTVLADYGSTRLEADAPPLQRDGAAVRYSTRVDGQQVELLVRDRRCSDTMTGMPYPYEVTLVLGERRLEGCGGDPRTLFVGETWALDERSDPADPPLTLRFDAQGRLYGEAVCHTLGGTYTLTGEGLRLAPEYEAHGSCGAERADRERQLFERMRAVYRFSRPDEGILLLHAPGRVLSARR